MCGAQFAEGKCTVDHWLQASGENVAEDFMKLAHGSHVGTQQAQLPCKEVTQVDANLGTGGRSTGDQRAGGLERFHALVPGGAAHVLDRKSTRLKHTHS